MNSTVTIPDAGRYRFDPKRGTITFRTRHLFGLGRVSGTAELRQAEMEVGYAIEQTSVRATVDAASLSTGHDRRDSAVHSPAYLDTAAHPDITFACGGLHHDGAHWIATGELTAHGVTAPLEMTVRDVERDGAELRVRATATVDRYAHGITSGKGLAARRLSLEISAVAIAA